MTSEEREILFREKYNWLADHPDKKTFEYFESNEFKKKGLERPINSCWACEEAMERRDNNYKDDDHKNACDCCPVAELRYCDFGSMYAEFIEAGRTRDRERRAVLARRIAAMEWK